MVSDLTVIMSSNGEFSGIIAEVVLCNLSTSETRAVLISALSSVPLAPAVVKNF